MPKARHVYNTTRKFWLKMNQAQNAVAQCACAWVEFGVSVRDLTIAEAVQARNEQAKQREPLAMAEIPGLVFQPPPAAAGAERQSRRVAAFANQFAARAIEGL